MSTLSPYHHLQSGRYFVDGAPAKDISRSEALTLLLGWRKMIKTDPNSRLVSRGLVKLPNGSRRRHYEFQKCGHFFDSCVRVVVPAAKAVA